MEQSAKKRTCKGIKLSACQSCLSSLFFFFSFFVALFLCWSLSLLCDMQINCAANNDIKSNSFLATRSVYEGITFCSYCCCCWFPLFLCYCCQRVHLMVALEAFPAFFKLLLIIFYCTFPLPLPGFYLC